MDAMLEKLVNDGLPPEEDREDALFLMLAGLVQAQVQTAQRLATLAEAISQLALAITQEADPDDLPTSMGYGGLDG